VPELRDIAVDLSPADAPPLNTLYNIRSWVRDHFEFVRDTTHAELLQDVPRLLKRLRATGVARGDCDDAAVLAGALACSVGYHVCVVTVAILDSGVTKAYTPDRIPFGHVWSSGSPPMTCTDRAGRQVWIEFDVTRPMQDIPLERIARAEATLVC
jgi:hypothetical protein